ncbi:MAG: 5-bromo-4-chloroindolyl phosphate hydrolysis family protein [Candidatus Faecousia sp.]|nr:5-bromo-4-chloroindolyl phosphate hydrolysis family protein [Clostridiales bacterium]MDY6180538.1 5-bromo-4-chloroindolyl phosphate hydrolysis family protein [Candidatus Faecousia sp.]
MANNVQHPDWDDLGRSIQEAVDRAVGSRDFGKLNQTISDIAGKAVDMGTQAVRRSVENVSRPKPEYKIAKPNPPHQKAQKVQLPAVYAKTGGLTAWGVVKTALGGVFSFSFLIALLTRLLTFALMGTAILTWGVAVLGVFLAGSVWMLGSGISDLCELSRFNRYRKALGTSTHLALEKLARSVGKTEKFVRRELRRMIDKGLFLEGHLDKEETCLITSNETYRNFERSRLELEERKRQEAEERKLLAAREAAALEQKAASAANAQVQEVLDRGNAFIAQIRSCNDAIPGEEISGKISRMELIVQKIFQRAEAHPEIIPDLKKLMDYYLPMTVKLLTAYADMDAQPVQGETIQNSKREIEDTLDTLNLAFEKLLDSVFKDTALDVSSDISVLNTLLAREGLAEDEMTMKIQKT